MRSLKSTSPVVLFLAATFVAMAAGCPTPTPGPGPTRRVDPARRPAPALAATADQVQAALGTNLKQYRRRMRRCHELAMADNWRLGGRVVLALTVRQAGVVTAVKVVENGSGSKLLGRCLSHVARSFVFPASEGVHQLRLPMRFGRPRRKLTVRLSDAPVKAPFGNKVLVKPLLNPRSVSSSVLSMTAIRLLDGAKIPALRHGVPVAIYVLKGELLVTDGVRRERLMTGDGATLAAGQAHALEQQGRGAAVLLLFFGPAGPEGVYLTGKPATGSARVTLPAKGVGGLLCARIGPGAGPAFDGRRLSGPGTAAPVRVSLPAGGRATLNPSAAAVDHALLVTAGGLWLTVWGEQIPVGPGMAVILPATAGKIALKAAGKGPVSAVVLPWPKGGQLKAGPPYQLLR